MTTISRSTCVLLCVLASLSAALTAQGVLKSFEGGTSTGVFPGANNPEGWVTDGGLVRIAPYSSVPAPNAGFPTHGSQWMGLSSEGATGNLFVPVGGPAPYPFASGSTGSMRVPFPIPTSSAPLQLSFDWTFVTRECQNESSYNDFLTVDLTDGNGMVLQNLLYRDTHSGTLVSPAATVAPSGVAAGGCQSGSEEGPAGTPKALAVTVNPSLHGNNAVWLEIHVGNAGDGSVDSHAWFDRIELIGLVATYPGSNRDFRMLTGVNGPATAVDRKPVAPGDAVNVVVDSPQGSLLGAPIVMLLQAFPIGAYQGATPGLPDVAINLNHSYVPIAGLPGSPMGHPTLQASGFTFPTSGFNGFTGYSFLFQAAVFSPALPFGYATTNGHELYYPEPIFVSSTTGSSGAPGTATQPAVSIAQGYALAKSQGRQEVRVAAGTYFENGIQFDAAINVRGGYNPTTWSSQSNVRSLIVTNHRGIAVRNVNSAAVISGIEVQAANAPSMGPNSVVSMEWASVAMDVRNSGSGLRFENCLFQSGRGGDGRSGTMPSTVATNGSSGSSGSAGYYTLNAQSAPSGGAGGAGARVGGAGGRGGWANCVAGIFGPCTTGASASGVKGVNGSGSGNNGGPGGGPAVCNVATAGAGGTVGTPGAHGSNGLPALSPGGQILANGDWGPRQSATGTAGAAGGGGGGGGGGGCGECAQQFVSGGSGGGGGGGGGGGAAGTGAFDGGASFALYLHNASPTLTSCSFFAGLGGSGGNGGNGRAGGNGGSGASGGNGVNVTVFGFGLGSGAGGAGGNGGAGGGGGGGGGGHGGPSYCVFRAASSNPTGLTDPSNSFFTGAGGTPGLGGAQGTTGTLAPSGLVGPSGVIGT